MLVIKDNFVSDFQGSFSTDFEFYQNLQKCGHVTIQKDSPSGIAWLWNVEIFEQFRGKGLSHNLIQDALEYIKVAIPECIVVKLTVHFDNEIAQKTYKKCGFDFTGKLVGHSLYEMEMNL